MLKILYKVAVSVVIGCHFLLASEEDRVKQLVLDDLNSPNSQLKRNLVEHGHAGDCDAAIISSINNFLQTKQNFDILQNTVEKFQKDIDSVMLSDAEKRQKKSEINANLRQLKQRKNNIIKDIKNTSSSFKDQNSIVSSPLLYESGNIIEFLSFLMQDSEEDVKNYGAFLTVIPNCMSQFFRDINAKKNFQEIAFPALKQNSQKEYADMFDRLIVFDRKDCPDKIIFDCTGFPFIASLLGLQENAPLLYCKSMFGDNDIITVEFKKLPGGQLICSAVYPSANGILLYSSQRASHEQYPSLCQQIPNQQVNRLKEEFSQICVQRLTLFFASFLMEFDISRLFTLLKCEECAESFWANFKELMKKLEIPWKANYQSVIYEDVFYSNIRFFDIEKYTNIIDMYKNNDQSASPVIKCLIDPKNMIDKYLKQNENFIKLKKIEHQIQKGQRELENLDSSPQQLTYQDLVQTQTSLNESKQNIETNDLSLIKSQIDALDDLIRKKSLKTKKTITFAIDPPQDYEITPDKLTITKKFQNDGYTVFFLQAELPRPFWTARINSFRTGISFYKTKNMEIVCTAGDQTALSTMYPVPDGTFLFSERDIDQLIQNMEKLVIQVLPTEDEYNKAIKKIAAQTSSKSQSLEERAQQLGIKKGSQEWKDFFKED